MEWFGEEPNPRIIRETFTIEAAPEYATNVLNIGQASPQGTFLGGTFINRICDSSAAPTAGFYRYSKKCGVKKISVPNLKVSAGIAWNADSTKLYHVSTCDRVVREFNYNPKTGKVCKFPKKSNQFFFEF